MPLPSTIATTSANTDENVFVRVLRKKILRISPEKNPYAASSNSMGINGLGKGGRPVASNDTSGVTMPHISPSHCPHSMPHSNTGKCIGENSDDKSLIKW